MSDNNTASPAIQQLPGDASNLRVTIDGDGVPSVEFLDVADSKAVSHSADVQPYPTADEFTREIDSHNKVIADLQAKLSEQRFDSRTGQVKGPAYEGEVRRHLELQLTNRQNALNFTTFNLTRAQAAAERRAAERAEALANGRPDAGTSQLVEAGRREALIAATAADIGADGKPLGRVKATQLVDDELARDRVAARVQAMR